MNFFNSILGTPSVTLHAITLLKVSVFYLYKRKKTFQGAFILCYEVNNAHNIGDVLRWNSNINFMH